MGLLWKYLKRHKKILWGALVLAALNQFFSLLDPQVFRLLIDNYATNASEHTREEFISGVLLLILAYIGVALFSRIAKNFQDYFANVMTERVGAELYNDSVTHAFSLPFAAFEDQKSGELLSKLQKARADSQKFIQNFINILFFSAIGVLFVLVYAFIVHWIIGLLFSLIIPLLGVTIFIISRKIRDHQKAIFKETAILAGSTTETLRNVELVKSLGLEKQETDRLNLVVDKIVKLELRKVKLIRILSFIQGTFVNLLRSVIMFVMLWLVFRQSITLGEFFSLLFYSFFIFNPLGELGAVSSSYQEAKASMHALEEILEQKPEEKPESPVPVDTVASIRFDDASFKYNGAQKEALEKINLEIKKGETVAFVGPSGSGKTTLVKLLLGLYKPTSGQMLVNGTDVRQIDFDRLRTKIGYVSQDTQLFAGTIRENLLFVNPRASDEECLKALEDAAAESLLQRTEEGLDTRIGEGGLKLSGGERQRLAIARALLRRPDVIVFDEATSALDSLTEKAITDVIQNINQTNPDLITILVAHRLSTVAHADKIYVLEKGKVSEQGDKNSLLQQSGLFAALWRQQMAEREPANT